MLSADTVVPDGTLMVTAMNGQPGPQAGLNPQIEPADPSTLHYDLRNPRMADLVF